FFLQGFGRWREGQGSHHCRERERDASSGRSRDGYRECDTLASQAPATPRYGRMAVDDMPIIGRYCNVTTADLSIESFSRARRASFTCSRGKAVVVGLIPTCAASSRKSRASARVMFVTLRISRSPQSSESLSNC